MGERAFESQEPEESEATSSDQPQAEIEQDTQAEGEDSLPEPVTGEISVEAVEGTEVVEPIPGISEPAAKTNVPITVGIFVLILAAIVLVSFALGLAIARFGIARLLT